MNLEQFRTLEKGDVVRINVPSMGSNANDDETTIEAGAVGIVDRTDDYNAPQLRVVDLVIGTGDDTIVNSWDEADFAFYGPEIPLELVKMPVFKVDVKAFMSVTIKARTADEARAAANLYAEFGQEFIAKAKDPVVIIDDDGWCVDGYSEVEKICPSCEENYLEEEEQICTECEEEAA